MKPASTHSQYGQDVFLFEHFFADQASGTFIEIGADDGVQNSNTLMYEQLGWTGLCIEPRPLAYERLVKNRNCICENCGVFNEEKTLDFIAVEGYGKGLSGIVDTYSEQHKKRLEREMKSKQAKDSVKEVIQVTCYPLQTLLDKHGIKEVDYCSIDTEGSEYEVLQSIDWNKTRIRVFTIENNYNDRRSHELLLSKGYRLAATVKIDDVYVLEE